MTIDAMTNGKDRIDRVGEPDAGPVHLGAGPGGSRHETPDAHRRSGSRRCRHRARAGNALHPGERRLCRDPGDTGPNGGAQGGGCIPHHAEIGAGTAGEGLHDRRDAQPAGASGRDRPGARPDFLGHGLHRTARNRGRRRSAGGKRRADHRPRRDPADPVGAGGRIPAGNRSAPEHSAGSGGSGRLERPERGDRVHVVTPRRRAAWVEPRYRRRS